MPPGRSSEEGRGTTGGFSDEAHFEDFYKRTAPALRGYIMRISGSAFAADDVLQTAYVRLLNAPAMDDAQRKSYLYKTATNCVIDEWRKRSREEKRFLEQHYEEGHSKDPSISIEMERALAQLSPQSRALLWLAYVDGYDHDEIAEILQLSPKSVRVLLFRARGKVKDMLGPEGKAVVRT